EESVLRAVASHDGRGCAPALRLPPDVLDVRVVDVRVVLAHARGSDGGWAREREGGAAVLRDLVKAVGVVERPEARVVDHQLVDAGWRRRRERRDGTAALRHRGEGARIAVAAADDEIGA